MIQNNKVPIVFFGHSETDLGFDWIDVDNFAGGYMMTEYLLKQGHRDIAMISLSKSSNGEDRLRGYMKALKDFDVPYQSGLVKYTENTEADGYVKTLELLSAGGVSAIFCATDMLALGSIRAAKTFGLSVPNDISIAGFDGLGYHLLTDPKITTIRQPVYQTGQKLAEGLIGMISGQAHGKVNILIKPELVVESSVIRREQ